MPLCVAGDRPQARQRNSSRRRIRKRKATLDVADCPGWDAVGNGRTGMNPAAVTACSQQPKSRWMLLRRVLPVADVLFLDEPSGLKLPGDLADVIQQRLGVYVAG